MEYCPQCTLKCPLHISFCSPRIGICTSCIIFWNMQVYFDGLFQDSVTCFKSLNYSSCICEKHWEGPVAPHLCQVQSYVGSPPLSNTVICWLACVFNSRVDLNHAKILGSKREDRFSDHLPNWYKISVRLVFRTCFASAFSVRARGTCESSGRSARR